MENTEILNDNINVPDTDESIIPPTYGDDETEVIDVSSTETAPNEVPEADSEADALRRELSELQAYVENRKAEEEKALNELEEFSRLYPDVSVDSIDDSVWVKVRNGLPLSAAYALSLRELELQKILADQVNLRNSAASAGSAGTPPRLDYFSPDEVKAMSGKEIRQNYANIRKSMDYWRKASK